ncbi:MAG: alkaline phosphatase [Pseudomonadota bacterium]
MHKMIKALGLMVAFTTLAGIAKAEPQTGNVIFFHPDGAGVNHWNAARIHTVGPDGELNWDKLPAIGVYTGHMADRLTATSHGGATVHSRGVKVQADSFGMNGTETITAASGVPQSIAQDALAAGKAVALVQTGHIGEPGTAVFLSESEDRGDVDHIARQVIEAGAEVILGGGEKYLLPEGVEGRHGMGERTDGANLITLADSLGYTIVYTREELLGLDLTQTRKVLGVFAHNHTFNDNPIGINLAKDLPAYSVDAPTVAEMTAAALAIVSRDPDGFFVVVEEEATDNFPNDRNAAGALEALARADEAFGIMLDFVNARSDTLLITAADSDAGGLQVVSVEEESPFVHGQYGLETALFTAPADNRGIALPFAIGFVADGGDVSGGILVRGAGFNRELITPLMDNTDVYKVMHTTLFGTSFDD